MENNRRWLTCTPVRFKGDQTFFARESGLLCKGFQEIGVECKAIMPGPAMEGDEVENLIRTDYRNLEDPEWWRSHGAEGVVLYAWGAWKYTRIATAIKRSGTFLVSNMDTHGLVSPYTTSTEWARLCFDRRRLRHGLVLGSILFAAECSRALCPALFDKRRLEHLGQADRITVVTPMGAEIIKRLSQRFACPQIAEKTSYMPHPQLGIYRYNGTPKENIVICVARWAREDWSAKNPEVLFRSLSSFLHRRNDYRAIVVGRSAKGLKPMRDRHCRGFEGRVELIDHVEPKELETIYQNAKIGFWSSRDEGQQGTGAQALCCGCSVVSTGGISMNCFHHYASRASGRVAPHNSADILADTLFLEAEAWDQGWRDPERISRAWTAEFHAPEVARRYLAMRPR